MNTTTLTELDAYRATFAQEGEITKKLLRAFPEDKVDLRPCETGQSARELASTLTLTFLVLGPILAGKLLPGELPPPPKEWKDLVANFEREFEGAKAKLASLDDAAMSGMVTTVTGKDVIEDVRRADLLRLFLHDQIHHRGQLSVLLRMAGAKVPSIYGPSKDEPWF
jgi:uncharacterized damage-inducible protein DinB